jgi:hypothetical protein
MVRFRLDKSRGRTQFRQLDPRGPTDASCCTWRYRPEADATSGYATTDASDPCEFCAAESSVKADDGAAAEAAKIAPRGSCQIWLLMPGEKGLFRLRK